MVETGTLLRAGLLESRPPMVAAIAAAEMISLY